MQRKQIRKKSAPRKSKAKRRTDWKLNDEAITSAFAELWMKHQKIPSYEDIARHMNVDVSTIKRHVKEMDFDERFKRFRIMSDKVVMNVFKQAATGKSHHFARMWLELFEDLGAKKKIDVTSGGNPINPISAIEIIHTDAKATGQPDS